MITAKYNIRHEIEIVVSNQQVASQKCNAIRFENKGTDTPTINNYPLFPSDPILKLGESHPDIINEQNYSVNFTGVGTKKVMVIRSFIEEIKKTC